MFLVVVVVAMVRPPSDVGQSPLDVGLQPSDVEGMLEVVRVVVPH